MTTLTTNDKKILRRIREKVISTHWVKGYYYRVIQSGPNKGKEKCCLVGMVNVETLPEGVYDLGDPGLYGSGTIYAEDTKVAKTKVVRRDRILHALREAAEKQSGRGLLNIEDFNDHEDTRRNDVVDVIDIALGEKADA